MTGSCFYAVSRKCHRCVAEFMLTEGYPGHNIPVIENLGVTKDLNDSIDLTDNSIRVLGNFPKLLRLRTLLLARNRISHIQPTISQSIPRLQNLVLTGNSIANLAELDPLSGFPDLTFLSLVDNPVTSIDYYRSWVIWRNPHVRVLDFQKVKDAERTRAKELFGLSHSEPTELATQIMGTKSSGIALRTFDSSANGTTGSTTVVQKLTEEEKEMLRQSLKHATSLVEINRIEQALKNGH